MDFKDISVGDLIKYSGYTIGVWIVTRKHHQSKHLSARKIVYNKQLYCVQYDGPEMNHIVPENVNFLISSKEHPDLWDRVNAIIIHEKLSGKETFVIDKNRSYPEGKRVHSATYNPGSWAPYGPISKPSGYTGRKLKVK